MNLQKVTWTSLVNSNNQNNKAFIWVNMSTYLALSCEIVYMVFFSFHTQINPSCMFAHLFFPFCLQLTFDTQLTLFSSFSKLSCASFPELKTISKFKWINKTSILNDWTGVGEIIKLSLQCFKSELLYVNNHANTYKLLIIRRSSRWVWKVHYVAGPRIKKKGRIYDKLFPRSQIVAVNLINLWLTDAE